jgi:hypothetical protein
MPTLPHLGKVRAEQPASSQPCLIDAQVTSYRASRDAPIGGVAVRGTTNVPFR